MHRALLATLDVLSDHMSVIAYACSDHIAVVWHSAGSIVMALASEREGSSRRQCMESFFPDSQQSLLSWSIFVHLGLDPDSLPPSLQLSLAQFVLRAMAVPTSVTVSKEPHRQPSWMRTAVHRSASAVFSSYIAGPRPSPSPPPHPVCPVLATAHSPVLLPPMGYKSSGPGTPPPSPATLGSLCPACPVLYLPRLPCQRDNNGSPQRMCAVCMHSRVSFILDSTCRLFKRRAPRFTQLQSTRARYSVTTSPVFTPVHACPCLPFPCPPLAFRVSLEGQGSQQPSRKVGVGGWQ